jgi:hypothetical protein
VVAHPAKATKLRDVLTAKAEGGHTRDVTETKAPGLITGTVVARLAKATRLRDVLTAKAEGGHTHGATGTKGRGPTI